jgi:hypothetical protein
MDEGLYLSGANTNYALHSNDFTNAAWTNSGSPVVTSNQTTSPTGSVDADKVVFSASGDYLQQLTTASPPFFSTSSIWLKAVSSDVDMKIHSMKDSVSGGSITETITSSSWVRVPSSILVLGAVNFGIRIECAETGGGEVYIAYAEISSDLRAGSAMETTTSAVTTALDYIEYSNIPAALVNDFAIIGAQSVMEGTMSPYHLWEYYGGGSDSIAINTASGTINLVVKKNGTSVTVTSSASVASGDMFDFSIRIDDTLASFIVNGVVDTAVLASGDMGGATKRVRFGQLSGSATVSGVLGHLTIGSL